MVRPGNDPEVPVDGRTLDSRNRKAKGGRRLSDDQTIEPEIIRGTSDQLIIAIAEVGALEGKKRGVLPSDPAFPSLALEVRRAAERVLDLARNEEIVARRMQEQPETAKLPPIERISPAKELAAILEEWRAVEQKLLRADASSAEAAELQGRFDDLRDRYARALKARQHDG